MNEDIFKHKLRKMIYKIIIFNPGIVTTKIREMLELSKGTLRYHLKYLEKHKEITSKLENNNKSYYPIQTLIFNHRLEPELEIIKLNNSQVALLNAIQRYPGLTQKDLIYKTGLNRTNIIYNLNKLLNFGVLSKVKNGKFIKYYQITNPLLRRKILEVIFLKFINYEIDEQSFLALKNRVDRI